ncbi:substrate-binding domain-containing protein [Maridesulfovibrio frigidus]|uniref:substrate-binding domain-containing protein n=1 Tax=Maridesulfovibrio frigidus TaxID=340956 RepID=UPI0004E1F4D5|nr:substrate-binding domain-containing protein [Maridesulfovibrio frigidus]
MLTAYKNILIGALAFCSLLCFAVLSTAQAADYFTIEELYKIHPEEKSKAEKFNARVKGDAPALSIKPLNFSVAIVYPGEQISDYWRRSSKSFKARLEQYGIEPQIHSFYVKPTASLREQNIAFNKALAKKPDFLIFTLDALRHKRMIEPILITDKPALILQNITTPIKAWEDKQPLMYIGFDHVTGSTILAQYFAKKTHGNGSYAVLLPGPGYLSEVRGKTFISYMDNNTKLKLVSVYQTGIDKEKARLATLAILDKNPDIDFIYTCATDIALGAIEALREKDMMEKVMVNGWGGGSSELKAIQNGEMDVTVMRINDDNGAAMADAVILKLLGESKNLPLVFSGRFELIERGISPQRLDYLKEKSFRYSGITKE